MTTADVLRPYLQQQIASIMGVASIPPDEDGDIVIRQGSTLCFARVLDGPTGPLFRVFAPVLKNVTESDALFERLNALNVGAPYVRFFWSDGFVYCGMDLLAEYLQREEIGNALAAVGWNADNLDELLKQEFGGERMIEDEQVTKPPMEIPPPEPSADLT
ncbi:MAG: YbjN domain-containing protein [Actinomycetota bacterium]